MAQSREIHLVRRPQGMPVADDFAVVVDTAAQISNSRGTTL